MIFFVILFLFVFVEQRVGVELLPLAYIHNTKKSVSYMVKYLLNDKDTYRCVCFN